MSASVAFDGGRSGIRPAEGRDQPASSEPCSSTRPRSWSSAAWVT